MHESETLERVLCRLAARAGQSGQVVLTSVSGRSDLWHATFDPGTRKRKVEAQARTPVGALLLLESALDTGGRP